jgi:hypothetical protein
MRMLVTVEFADAGTKSGLRGILTIGRGLEEMQSGDMGLSLEEVISTRTSSYHLPMQWRQESCRIAAKRLAHEVNQRTEIPRGENG